ncbi:MAG TPA: response regulator [Polyangia bacterium]|nr:response regulator [Polyangia bacterium]
MTDPLSAASQQKDGRRPLRVVLVEDNPDDAELVLRELRLGGYAPVYKRVLTQATLREALSTEKWDVIISDHSLPDFSAPEAFALVREMNIDIPFIIVSGTVGEEIAVEAMRSGVHDFLLKGHFKRLVAAIEREIREAAVRAERRTIREQLLISERMASMGTLAAGVAHEINNPLSVVAGNLHVIRKELESMSRHLAAGAGSAATGGGELVARLTASTDSLRDAVRDAEEASERVRAIVRDLRVFSRPEDDRRAAVDIHRVLESALRMARNELRQRARVELSFGEVPAVDGNEGRLGQIFLNLIVNAAHAIPEGRSLDNTVSVATRLEGDMVVVEISDTGSGIAPEIMPRIFDAFFTTKPIGVGTGLGLAICHRLLTAMNGRVEVDTTPGVGSTFRVFLPRAHAGRTPEVAEPAPASVARGRRCSVLVIEDEPALGRVLGRLLAPNKVTAILRAREALARIRAGEEFNLVLCDLMMPEMTGMEFHSELARTDRAAADRIVFMTGGAVTADARAFLEAVPNVQLDKPLDIPRLRRLVEDAAGGGRQSGG